MKVLRILGGGRFFAIAVVAACSARRLISTQEPQEAVAEAMGRFREFALAPARIPPPSVDEGWEVATSGGIQARARLLRPEAASWNTWPGRELRLFNDRWAWLVEVEVLGDVSTWWVEGTQLELNDEAHVALPAASPDEVIGDLLFWALQQERAALGDDLVARTRAAGAFRGAYLARNEEGMSGVVAFPSGDLEGLHVVAARFTLVVADDRGRHDLVFVFQ